MKHTDSARPCRARGLQLSAIPTAPGQKGFAASDMQRFGGFPGPDSLIPAIIATTGKGSFFGSCKITEIYWEEPGGITTPWPGRTRHHLGVGWVLLSQRQLRCPVPARRCEDREGEMKGSDVVAVRSVTLRVLLPRGTIPSWGWDSSVPAGPELARRTQRQKWGLREQRAAPPARGHGALILVL